MKPAPFSKTALSKLRGWRYAVTQLAHYRFHRFLSEHGYYEYRYRRKYGHPPNYANPRTLSEKLAWMRLYDRDPRYVQLVDKLAVRDWVRERVGEEVLVPLYGVWEKASDIQLDELPERFVLKCNHECGYVVLCKDRDQLDWPFVQAQLATRLKMNYYYRYLEWPYLNVTPRILAEELLENEQGGEPLDYKFYCFDGEPHYLYIVKDRHTKPIRAYFSTDWEPMPFYSPEFMKGPLMPALPRPTQFEQMLNIARKLSQGLRYCRVDLYEVREQVFFGEITLICGAGFLTFTPDSYSYSLGDRIKLPEAATSQRLAR